MCDRQAASAGGERGYVKCVCKHRRPVFAEERRGGKGRDANIAGRGV